MAAPLLIAEARNNEGEPMRMEFGSTFNWQAFVLHGLPSRMKAKEGKSLSLTKAVEAWNFSVASRTDVLAVGTVSQRIRKILDAARDAKAAATRAKPLPQLAA